LEVLRALRTVLLLGPLVALELDGLVANDPVAESANHLKGRYALQSAHSLDQAVSLALWVRVELVALLTVEGQDRLGGAIVDFQLLRGLRRVRGRGLTFLMDLFSKKNLSKNFDCNCLVIFLYFLRLMRSGY